MEVERLSSPMWVRVSEEVTVTVADMGAREREWVRVSEEVIVVSIFRTLSCI